MNKNSFMNFKNHNRVLQYVFLFLIRNNTFQTKKLKINKLRNEDMKHISYQNQPVSVLLDH